MPPIGVAEAESELAVSVLQKLEVLDRALRDLNVRPCARYRLKKNRRNGVAEGVIDPAGAACQDDDRRLGCDWRSQGRSNCDHKRKGGKNSSHGRLPSRLHTIPARSASASVIEIAGQKAPAVSRFGQVHRLDVAAGSGEDHD